jgi:hypothetical protein
VEERQPGNLHPVTITHARLRASQGDIERARGILRALLAERPHDAEALGLLERLECEAEAAELPPVEDRPDGPQPADAAGLRDRFRQLLGGAEDSRRREAIRRLESMARKVERLRKGSDAG